MIDEIPYLIETASSLYLGYSIGRHSTGERLTDWADNVLTTGIRKSWRYPTAVIIALVAVALLWTFHPRRTLANVRAWKIEQAPAAPERQNQT